MFRVYCNFSAILCFQNLFTANNLKLRQRRIKMLLLKANKYNQILPNKKLAMMPRDFAAILVRYVINSGGRLGEACKL